MPSTQDSKYRGLVLQVAVPSPLYRTFDYLPPQPSADTNLGAELNFKTKPGLRVLVPFGNRKLVGILLAVAEGSEVPPQKLKPALAILDSKPVFSKSIFKLLQWAAKYYQHPIGEVFATALPVRLRSSSPRRRQRAIWSVVAEPDNAALAALSRSPKQRALLEFIQAEVEVSREQYEAANFNSSLLKQLQTKGLIEKRLLTLDDEVLEAFTVTDNAEPQQTLKLNVQQQAAVSSIEAKLDSFGCFLLDGVTGSGKTEVYMRAMQRQLRQGKQCLVLVPEIGLTPQTVARFEERFPYPVVALHSGLNDGERAAAWEQAKHSAAAIIIGTRSAVFTPMLNPGLIIIDEEHDPSFKQQDGFRYSARDLAVMRAREEKVCVILGSATPSLESLHNARRKKFTLLRLDERAGDAKPSTMEIIDVAEQTLDNGFSDELLSRIKQHIAQQNQVLVFINRRGFAPILSCQNCGWIAECEDCVAQFTVHAKPRGIRCHHCGSSRQLPRHCPSCNSKDLTTIGIGTQKIEAFLKRKFPATRVIRIDRDSTRNKNSLQELLSQVEQGDPCILLGTQMLAKGHHFPNITLVAVMDADSGLFSADFRGQEHMAQTIVQVAGRAGRAQRRGEVLIQSRHSAHDALQALSQNSYGEFAELLLSERKISAMPPFSHLCVIRAEADEQESPLQFLQQVANTAQALSTEHGWPVDWLGPLPAPMEKRAGKYRMQLQLKCSQRAALQDLLSRLIFSIGSLKTPRTLRWSIDVDPQDLI